MAGLRKRVTSQFLAFLRECEQANAAGKDVDSKVDRMQVHT